VPLVGVPGVFDHLVIASILFVANFAFVFYMAQKAHGIAKGGRWL
jgi:hypothetical protein